MSTVVIVIIIIIAIIAWVYFYKKGSTSITESMKVAETQRKKMMGVDEDLFKTVVISYEAGGLTKEISIDFAKAPIRLSDAINRVSEKTKTILLGTVDKNNVGQITTLSDNIKLKKYHNGFILTNNIPLDVGHDFMGISKVSIDGVHIYDGDNVSHLGEVREPLISFAVDPKIQEKLIGLGFIQLFKDIFIRNILLITKVDPVE